MIRIAVWTALGALFCLAAAAVTAKIYFTPERLKKLALEYSSRTLGREVAFDSIELGLSGLSINSLKVSEYPDFKKGVFFSASSFSVKPSFAALLHREIKINSISASGLKMQVKEISKNVYNFQDLLAARQEAPPAQNAAGKTAPAPLTITSLKIRDSRFHYANASGDMTADLAGINFSASGISPSDMFPVETDLRLTVASPYFNGTIPAKLKGRVGLGNWDLSKGRLKIEKASLALGGVKADIKGNLTGFLEPDAKLSIAVRQFSTDDLKAVFPVLPAKILLPGIDADADFKLTAKDLTLRSIAFRAGQLSGQMKGRAAWDPKITYDLSADIKAQTPEFDTTALAGKVKPFPVPHGYKLPLANVSARVLLKNGLADIRDFSLDCDAISIKGRTAVNFSGPSPKAEGSFNADIKNLSRLASIAPALMEPYGLSGAAGVELTYAYSETLSVTGKAAVKGAGAVFAEHRLSELGGSVDFTKDSAVSQKLEGKLDGAAVRASFKVRDLTTHPKAEFDLNLAKLTLKDAPPAQARTEKAKAGEKAGGRQFYADISGQAQVGAIEHPNFNCGPASMKLALTNISEDMKALDGTASFTAGPGRFTELYALAANHKAAKVALYPLIVLGKASTLVKALRLPDFNNVSFDLIEGDYTFAHGLMKLNKSRMTSNVADVNSSGSIDLPAESLNMRVSTKMKQSSGIVTNTPVDMLVKGTFSAPSVKLDIKSIAEQPAVKKAIDKLVPEGSKLLKSLFGK